MAGLCGGAVEEAKLLNMLGNQQVADTPNL
jgi:hypothetical protein